RPVPPRFHAFTDSPHRIGADGQTRTYDIALLDETGERFGYIEGFTLRRAPREAFMRFVESADADRTYRIAWQPAAAAAGEPHQVMLAGDADAGVVALEQLSAALRTRGATVEVG